MSRQRVSAEHAPLPALSFEAEAADLIAERLSPFMDANGIEPDIRVRILTVATAIAQGLSGQRLCVETDIAAQDVQLVITPVADGAADPGLEVWARFDRASYSET